MIRPSMTPYSSSVSSRGYCNICYNPYNLDEFKPLLICPNDHCICKQCLIAIKNTLRCPFCRTQLRLDRIRLNQTAVDFIIAISRRGSQLSAQSKVAENRVQERLITQQTNNNQNRPQPVYLDEAQFRGQDQEDPPPALGCSCWVFLVYFYLLVLHLPVGIFNVYIATNFPHSTYCLDFSLPDSSYTLRYQWSSNGFLQILISAMALYFTITTCFRILNIQGLRMFQFLLVFFAEALGSISFFVYFKIVTDETIYQCPKFIANAILGNLITKGVTLMLGMFLLGKFYQYLL